MANGIKFDRMPCIYWSDITKASYIQRYIIVHSILYYQMNVNVISDSQFDDVSKQLLGFRSKMGETEYQKTEYFYCFKDFDANTGFYLYDALNENDRRRLVLLAQNVLRNYKKENRGQNNGN